MTSKCTSFLVALILLGLLATSSATAQRDPPIVESYLDSTSVERIDNGLKWNFSYTKTGGQIKKAYQYYVLAYSDRHNNKIAKLPPQEAIAQKLVCVLETKIAKRNKEGKYRFELKIDANELVDQMKKENQIADERTRDVGGWKSFDDQIRLAIFIPFLDDLKYSNLEGLPADKNDGNYGADPALLFETTTQRLELCYGIVQAVRLKEGQYHIQLNGNRPRVKAAK